MRFQRNTGAHGAAEWMCLTPTQSKTFCYARVVLAKNITFDTAGLDGWALGDLRWLSEAVPNSQNAWFEPEIIAAIRPDRLRRLPIGNWEPLGFRSGKGFFVRETRLVSARWLLLGPSLAAVRGGKPA